MLSQGVSPSRIQGFGFLVSFRAAVAVNGPKLARIWMSSESPVIASKASSLSKRIWPAKVRRCAVSGGADGSSHLAVASDQVMSGTASPFG